MVHRNRSRVEISVLLRQIELLQKREIEEVIVQKRVGVGAIVRRNRLRVEVSVLVPQLGLLQPLYVHGLRKVDM